MLMLKTIKEHEMVQWKGHLWIPLVVSAKKHDTPVQQAIQHQQAQEEAKPLLAGPLSLFFQSPAYPMP